MKVEDYIWESRFRTAPEWRLTESRFMLDCGVKWLTVPCGVRGAGLGTGELGTLEPRLLPPLAPLSTWDQPERRRHTDRAILTARGTRLHRCLHESSAREV